MEIALQRTDRRCAAISRLQPDACMPAFCTGAGEGRGAPPSHQYRHAVDPPGSIQGADNAWRRGRRAPLPGRDRCRRIEFIIAPRHRFRCHQKAAKTKTPPFKKSILSSRQARSFAARLLPARGAQEGQVKRGHYVFGARLATLFSKRTAYRMTRPALRRINDEDSDGLVALPPVAVVRQRLRTTVKEFAHAAPGRRAAALAAVWIAATGCEADLSGYDGEDALRTYRLAESELRAELRLTMARAINNEPHLDTRESMVHMLERLEELEQAAVAPKPQRRRRRR
jgi:hypothetical protein